MVNLGSVLDLALVDFVPIFLLPCDFRQDTEQLSLVFS